MTPVQVELVKASFRKLVPFAGQAATMFYSRLFEIAPETRPLFKRDLGGQYDKLIQMLRWVVANLHQAEAILPAVEELGRRHAGYDLEPHHYDSVGAALLWSLQENLAGEFTPAVREAWAAAYGMLAEIMQNAARSDPANESFSGRLIDGAGTAIYGALDWRDASDEPAEESQAKRPVITARKGRIFWWR